MVHRLHINDDVEERSCLQGNNDDPRENSREPESGSPRAEVVLGEIVLSDDGIDWNGGDQHT